MLRSLGEAVSPAVSFSIHAPHQCTAETAGSIRRIWSERGAGTSAYSFAFYLPFAAPPDCGLHLFCGALRAASRDGVALPALARFCRSYLLPLPPATAFCHRAPKGQRRANYPLNCEPLCGRNNRPRHCLLPLPTSTASRHCLLPLPTATSRLLSPVPRPLSPATAAAPPAAGRPLVRPWVRFRIVDGEWKRKREGWRAMSGRRGCFCGERRTFLLLSLFFCGKLWSSA